MEEFGFAGNRAGGLTHIEGGLEVGLHHLPELSGCKFLEPGLLLWAQPLPVRLALQPSHLLFRAVKDVRPCGDTDPLCVGAAVEAEGVLPLVQVNQVSLPEVAPHQDLDGVRSAHVGLHHCHDLSVPAGRAHLPEADLRRADAYGQTRARMTVKIHNMLNRGLVEDFRAHGSTSLEKARFAICGQARRADLPMGQALSIGHWAQTTAYGSPPATFLARLALPENCLNSTQSEAPERPPSGEGKTERRTQKKPRKPTPSEEFGLHGLSCVCIEISLRSFRARLDLNLPKHGTLCQGLRSNIEPWQVQI